MSLLDRLSTPRGLRGMAGNQEVAASCLAGPEGVAEVVAGLAHEDVRIRADCAETLTLVAAQRPELIAPHGEALLAQLGHKNTRLRWEATHALALVAHLLPGEVDGLARHMVWLLRQDTSLIVRDYAVDALGGLAAQGAEAAERCLPLLVESLEAWEGRHAGHALAGLGRAQLHLPERREEIRALAETFLDHPKGSVAKAARALCKSCAVRREA